MLKLTLASIAMTFALSCATTTESPADEQLASSDRTIKANTTSQNTAGMVREENPVFERRTSPCTGKFKTPEQRQRHRQVTVGVSNNVAAKQDPKVIATYECE